MGRVRDARSATAWTVSGLALYAAALVVVATRSGPGISVDSVYYVHGADSFARTGEVSAFGLPLTLWPVGYPLTLGMSLRLGADPQAVALVVNVLSVAATVVLTYLVGRNVLRSPRAGLLAAAIVALSSSTVRVFAMLWTEPLFTPLVLGVLLLLVRALQRRDLGWGTALGIGALVSVATLLRYVGVVLLPVVLVGVLLALRARGRQRALLTAALAGMTALIGLALLVVRNLGLGVAPLGDRVAGGLPLTNVVGHSLRALGRYVVPETGGLMPLGGDPSGTAYVVVTGLTIALGVLVALVLLAGLVSAIAPRQPALLLIAVFVIAWWGALAYSAMATGVDPPNERLLAPGFAPMVILAIGGGRRLAAAASSAGGMVRRWGSRALSGLSVAVLALTLLAGAVVGGGASWAAARDGIGYNAVAVRTSPLGQALAALPAGSLVAASDPWLAWWVARKETTTIYDAALREEVAAGEVDYVAFFTASTAAHRTPEVLEAEGVRMRLVATYADGALYEATPGSPADETVGGPAE